MTEVKKNRYKVRPARDLTSNFEKRLKKKEEDKLEAEEQKKVEEAAAKTAVRCMASRGAGGPLVSLSPSYFKDMYD